MEQTNRQIMERGLVRALLRHMRAAGWIAWRTFDGDTFEVARNDDDIMALCFNLDEVSVRFAPDGLVYRQGVAGSAKALGTRRCLAAEHGVLLVMGNGQDIVSDWSYRNDDPDGFNAAMVAFDAETEIVNGLKLEECDRIAVLAGNWLMHRDEPYPVMHVGTDGHVRRLGTAAHLEGVDMVLKFHSLTAQRVEHVSVDERGWRKEVYVARA
jgi:hypothetical protein